MIITTQRHDSQQVGTLDVDLAQMAEDMDRLHRLAWDVDDAAKHEHFARLEHTVNWRLNQLAYVLAAQDSGSMTTHR